MIVVLASRFDTAAAALAETWRGCGACLLTCADLSRRGWRHEAASPDRSFAVLGEKRVPVREIRGVFTRLHAVVDDELPQIAAEERAYVAAEMNAFLVAWTSSLPCRVVNRPTPLCLNGPNWRHEQWAAQAARVGLAIEPTYRVARRPSKLEEQGTAPSLDRAKSEPISIIMRIGERVLIESEIRVDPTLVQGAHRLAQASGVDILAASFTGEGSRARLTGASTWVDVGRADVASALQELLQAPT